MRNFSPELLASLDGAEPIMRGMIRFDFPSGEYGFWDGDTDFEYDGVTFRPGKPIKLEDVNAGAGLDAVGLQVTLTSLPAEGLDIDALSTIEEEDYIGRPVTLYMAYFNPAGALIEVQRVWRGYVDGFDHIDEPGGESKLVCRLESKALDNAKEGHRLRSPADQVRISAGDKGLDHVAIAGQQEMSWGRKPDKPAK